MTDSNNQENKQETLNEETKKKGLSMEALKQVTGGKMGKKVFCVFYGSSLFARMKESQQPIVM